MITEGRDSSEKLKVTCLLSSQLGNAYVSFGSPKSKESAANHTFQLAYSNMKQFSSYGCEAFNHSL